MIQEEKEKTVLDLLKNIVPVENKEKLLKDASNLLKVKSCLTDNDLTKSMIGSGSTWGYLPHFMDVVVGKTSLSDKLKDEKCLSQIVKKTIIFCDKYENGKISRNRVFQSLKAYNGHHVSNFRPVAARDVYLSLVGEEKSVFDPCAGWGGRMMGAYGAKAISYLGLDASSKTVNGLNAISNDLGTSNKYKVLHIPVEDFEIDKPFADISFTSPPYFDAEKYSEDKEQSYVRYDTYPKWRDGFLVELCRKSKEAVYSGGYVVINIADIKKLPLEKDTNEILLSLDLEYVKTYRYILSSISGKGVKYEPVFIYRKK